MELNKETIKETVRNYSQERLIDLVTERVSTYNKDLIELISIYENEKSTQNIKLFCVVGMALAKRETKNWVDILSDYCRNTGSIEDIESLISFLDKINDITESHMLKNNK